MDSVFLDSVGVKTKILMDEKDHGSVGAMTEVARYLVVHKICESRGQHGLARRKMIR
jgi:hypothetical protein